MLSKKEFEEVKNNYEKIRKSRLIANDLQCAACGFVGNITSFYNSSVHSKFKICPVCGTVKFVCNENKGYVKL